MASGSAHSLPLKLGQALWSNCRRETSSQGTWTALSSLPNSPHSWNQRYFSVQSPPRPCRLLYNALPLIATKTTPPLTQILLHETQRFHSNSPGKGPENPTQRQQVIAGDTFSALISSSSPMPNNIQIILDGQTATTSGNFNEPASKADSTSSNTSSKNSTESASSNQSSSNKDNHSKTNFPFLFASFLISIFTGVAVFYHEKGRNRGAQDLTAQLPDGKIFAEREYLRNEEQKLKQCPAPQRKQEKELAEKIKALDKKELEHLRERAMVLEGKLETEEASIEEVRARDNAAANEEMAQIMMKEALKIRERKSNHVSSIASGMLLGSALAFGVTMLMSVARQ